MALMLGIDIGTSSAKALLADERGVIRASASASYPLHRPHPGWSEQDPADWWRATVDVIRSLLATTGVRAEEIVGVGLSGQMHGSVLLGRDAREESGSRATPLRPAILWNDQRTGAECEQIEREVGGKRRLVEHVGNAALTGFTLPKLLWVRGHEPGVWSRVAHVLLPKDFVRLRLTGELATDVGDASGTLAFNVDERGWNELVMNRLGMSRSMFPAAHESAAVTGRITRWAAEQTGLREGTIVVGGSGDNQAGAVGAGVVSPGMVLATLGTSGVIYAHADRPRKDLPTDGSPEGRLHTMCAATGTDRDRRGWCVTGVMLSAAGSLQWARDALFPRASFDELVSEAGSVEAGCEGLVFLPYLTGERCPYPEPGARGAWIGLTSRHSRGHLVRSVIEGVTFSMGQILDLVRSAGVPVESVRLGGGGAKSDLWRQVQADVYGCDVVVTNADEGPALGVALLAGVGAGVWGSVAEATVATIREVTRITPGADATRYEPGRRAHGALWPAIRDLVPSAASSPSRE